MKQATCALALVLSLTLAVASAAEPGAPPYVRDETRPEVLAERAESFEADLRKLGFSGTVNSCSHMVVLAVGAKGSNFSYGAICDVTTGGSSRKLLLCDDEMFGHFALAGHFSRGRKSIADFTRNNCYGG